MGNGIVTNRLDHWLEPYFWIFFSLTDFFSFSYFLQCFEKKHFYYQCLVYSMRRKIRRRGRMEKRGDEINNKLKFNEIKFDSSHSILYVFICINYYWPFIRYLCAHMSIHDIQEIWTYIHVPCISRKRMLKGMNGPPSDCGKWWFDQAKEYEFFKQPMRHRHTLETRNQNLILDKKFPTKKYI